MADDKKGDGLSERQIAAILGQDITAQDALGMVENNEAKATDLAKAFNGRPSLVSEFKLRARLGAPKHEAPAVKKSQTGKPPANDGGCG